MELPHSALVNQTVKTIMKQILTATMVIVTLLFLGACLHDSDSNSGSGGGGVVPQEEALSEWSELKNVSELYIIKETGWLRFVLDGKDPPRPIGEPPHVECEGNNVERRQLDLHLDAASAEEEAKIRVFTDILFSAFIRELPIQVRTDPTQCSNGNRFLVKDVRTLNWDL